MLGNLFITKKPAQETASNAASPVQAAPTVASNAPGMVPSAQITTQPEIGSAMQPTMRQDLSVMTHLDTRTTVVLHQAEEEAKRMKQPTIEPLQILFGLLFDQDIFQLLTKMSIDVSKLSSELQMQEQAGTFTGQPMLSEDSKKIFEEAYNEAKKREVEFITPEDVLIAFYNNGKISSFLKQHGVEKEKLDENLSESSTYVIGKKSVLEKYAIDLTQEAKKGKLDPVVGREREIERLIHIILRRTKNNPVIIGEAGVGKTALIEGLAQQIADGKAPPDLLSKKIMQLEISSLVAGASHRGEFEERLKNVIKETQLSEGRIMLFIDEIHTLIGAGEQGGALDASNIIKPYLARGQIQIIGATTKLEYRKYFEKDKAFDRRFQPVLVEEPTEEVALQMLQILKSKYENFHKVTILDEALKASVALSKKYIGERYLPDKAVDLLDEASAEVKLSYAQKKRQDNQVKKSDIEQVVSNWTGIPITRLTEDESQKLLKLEDLIHEKLIDQEDAVKEVAEAVRRGRIGLASPSRPIASFIFLGPTGVGKTELAKTLAVLLFGKEEAMIRLDMSEYMEKHEVAKLIGAPPGYVGYEEGGQLTEAVRMKPYSIVLLDEVEKAHPDVFNILLQLLEDGRLTDNKGNTISFKNTIVIATSNIGSALIQQQLSKDNKTPEEIKKGMEDLSQILMGELHKFFRPELLNRFDGVVTFKPLGKDDMRAIAKLGIEKTGKLLKEQGYNIEISEKALMKLAVDGYDPVYGARPLRRLIQSEIENPVALLLIKKEFIPGDTIHIEYNQVNEEFVFQKGVPNSSQQAVSPTQSSVNPSVIPPLQQDSQINQVAQQPNNQLTGATVQSNSAAN